MPEDLFKIPFLRGVNLLVDPMELEEGESQSTENLFPNVSRRLAKRKGAKYEGLLSWQATGVVGSMYQDGTPVNLIPCPYGTNDWAIVEQTLTDYFLHVSRVDELDSLSTLAGYITWGLESGYRPHLFEAFKAIYCLPGTNGAKSIIRSTAGGTASEVDFVGGTSSTLRPKVAALYRGRVVYGNLKAGYENCLVWSDPADPITIADDNYQLRYKDNGRPWIARTETASGYTPGETVTGGTSGATAEIVFDAVASGPDPVNGLYTGTLTLANVVGTFVDGELLTGSLGGGGMGFTATSSVGGAENLNIDWDARMLELDMPQGDKIVAMVEILQTAIGVPSQSALLVLGEYSAFIVQGEPPTTTETWPTDGNIGVSVYRVSYNCGCASPQTVVRTPFGVMWAGTDDVWAFAIGETPIRVGTKLKTKLEETAPTSRYLWHATYEPSTATYRLAVSPGLGVGCAEQYWLDLRSGIPNNPEEATWWGPQVYRIAAEPDTTPPTGTTCMAYDVRAGKVPAAYTCISGHSPQAVEADEYNLHLVKLDAQEKYDNGRPETDYLAAPISSREQVANSIDFDWKSREYSFDDPAAEKMLIAFDAALWCDDAVGMTGQAVAERGYNSGGQSGETNPAVMTDSLIEDSSVKRYLGMRFTPGGRVSGGYFYVELYDEPGYAAPDTERFWFGDGADAWYEAVIPENNYADVDAYLAALITAMQTASGWTFTGSVGAGDKVTIARTGGGTWVPGQDTSGYDGTAEEFKRTARVLAKLGFDTTDGAWTTPAASFTGDVSARLKRTAQIEIASIVAGFEQFGGRPR